MRVATRSLTLTMLAIGFSLAVLTGSSCPSGPTVSGTAEVIFDNGNAGGVSSDPTSPTTFTIQRSYQITLIRNYHWNGGAGTTTTGTISLVGDENTYGPWQTSGTDAMNSNWECTPNETIPPGTYTVVDSDPATWSHNSESDSAGMSYIEGIPMGDGPSSIILERYEYLHYLRVGYVEVEPQPVLVTSGKIEPAGDSTSVRDPRSESEIIQDNADAAIVFDTSAPRVVVAQTAGSSAMLTFDVSCQTNGFTCHAGDGLHTYTVTSISYVLDCLDSADNLIESIPNSTGHFEKTFTQGDGVSKVVVSWRIDNTYLMQPPGIPTPWGPYNGAFIGEVLRLTLTYE
ncbi:MAG: hypothetical protein JXQ75_01585 [Phycisphaerae bacterium]|nr:hypothetical protein [Phycisphaerae bacterium]